MEGERVREGVKDREGVGRGRGCMEAKQKLG